jgi:large subunit ribosomal protein L28
MKEIGMSKICTVCGKAPSAGRNVSHSHRVTNRVIRPNIQKVHVVESSGNVKQVNVCTKCLKAGKVTRA